MKVLMINGSPHAKGNTYIALHEMEKIFAEEGIETEILHIGNKDIRGCIACHSCAQNGKCVFDDLVNETAPKFRECDGLVVASPVYYASANATLIACLDRLFYSTDFDKTMKVGASVVCARRGGCTAQSAVCRWHPGSTGTAFMEESRERRSRIRKDFRACGLWRGICLF